jgi:ATP synthase protein I
MAGIGKESGRDKSGRDARTIRQRLDALEEELAEAKARHEPALPPDNRARSQAMGQALKLGTELVAGVAGGGFIGWALDRFFGTAPILMVLFLALGAAAGILNVIRSARAMQADMPPPADAQAADDDDDD